MMNRLSAGCPRLVAGGCLALSACLVARNQNLPKAEGTRPQIAGTRPRAAGKTIRISNFAFVPAELTVSRGDTVAWVNEDSFIHTTAADSAAWSSPEIAKGNQFVFVTSQVGRLSYHCEAHPVMRGEIVVQ